MVAGVPLPTDTSTVWPPPDLGRITADLLEADAWWSGDPARLAALYGRQAAAPNGRRSFWSRSTTSTKPTDRVHVPIAADIASVGADLLFGEDIRAVIDDAHGETPDPMAQATEARLVELLNLAQVQTTLLEGAEISGGAGGVYLRAMWDPMYRKHPFLSVVRSDRAVPEWRWGDLAAVTFWKVVATDGETVWRHLERYEPGWIYHGLYAGDKERLGARMALDKLAATASLDDEVNLTALLGVPDLLLARYVPNARPNRRHPGTPFGRQDTQGLESLMDSLDEAATALARDVRLGKSRIIVPDQFLDRSGRGNGAVFDADREIFSPLEMDPSDAANAGITPVQPEIRTQAHADAMNQYMRLIVSGAGYSPQTFGLVDGAAAVTATEVRAREADTLRTTARKQRYWEPNLTDLFEMLLIIDARVFGSSVTPMRPSVSFPPLASEDPATLAATLTALRNAQATSIETRVRMAQPGLDADAVQAEVERIKAEEGIVTDPTGGFV